ncbi:hypothetical protein M0813_18189 [Anaeramoeba flamelloides]|uniref:Uncharacterized protein n=1 Tax=Anaeramoeba flamelloides TaxID=1746091 RepID=A0ABQ8YU18_9EUKA|nr:hypothetical protein M0813_18189 [Anaeramoeba flamelloides]
MINEILKLQDILQERKKDMRIGNQIGVIDDILGLIKLYSAGLTEFNIREEDLQIPVLVRQAQKTSNEIIYLRNQMRQLFIRTHKLCTTPLSGKVKQLKTKFEKSESLTGKDIALLSLLGKKGTNLELVHKIFKSDLDQFLEWAWKQMASKASPRNVSQIYQFCSITKYTCEETQVFHEIIQGSPKTVLLSKHFINLLLSGNDLEIKKRILKQINWKNTKNRKYLLISIYLSIFLKNHDPNNSDTGIFLNAVREEMERYIQTDKKKLENSISSYIGNIGVKELMFLSKRQMITNDFFIKSMTDIFILKNMQHPGLFEN